MTTTIKLDGDEVEIFFNLRIETSTRKLLHPQPRPIQLPHVMSSIEPASSNSAVASQFDPASETQTDHAPVIPAPDLNVGAGLEGNPVSAGFPEVCEICGGTPCFWAQYCEDVKTITVESINEAAEDLPFLAVDGSNDAAPPGVGAGYGVGAAGINPQTLTNATIRKIAYRAYVRERYGFLGKANRIKLPACVLAGIRILWPDPDGSYMGYKEQ